MREDVTDVIHTPHAADTKKTYSLVVSDRLTNFESHKVTSRFHLPKRV